MHLAELGVSVGGVEGGVLASAGLQVDGEAGGVGPVVQVAHQRLAEAAALRAWVDADEPQVCVRVLDVDRPHRAVVAEPARDRRGPCCEDPRHLPQRGALGQRPGAVGEGDRGADDGAVGGVAGDPDPGAVAGRALDDPPEGGAVGEGSVTPAARPDRGPDRVVDEGGGENAGGVPELGGGGVADLDCRAGRHRGTGSRSRRLAHGARVEGDGGEVGGGRGYDEHVEDLVVAEHSRPRIGTPHRRRRRRR